MTATRRDLLTGATAIVAGALLPIGTTTPAAAAEAADAALRVLCEAHDRLLAIFTTESPGLAYKEANERDRSLIRDLADLEDKIAAAPAGTLAGLSLKWRVVFDMMRGAKAIDADDIDGRLMIAVNEDLARLAST